MSLLPFSAFSGEGFKVSAQNILPRVPRGASDDLGNDVIIPRPVLHPLTPCILGRCIPELSHLLIGPQLGIDLERC